jgi:hypothetical protein
MAKRFGHVNQNYRNKDIIVNNGVMFAGYFNCDMTEPPGAA